MAGTRVNWGEGRWTTAPESVVPSGDDLLVTAVEGSDAWRHTSYGFVHDTEHALVMPFRRDTAVEVTFTSAFSAQFDQAGLFLFADHENWIKAGVEFADGTPQVGAVVTRGRSDWSVSPVPEWLDRRVTVRASWSGDAVTIRARVEGEGWRLVRVVPWEVADCEAGPLVCAPTRAGLTVRLHDWSVTPPDAALH